MSTSNGTALAVADTQPPVQYSSVSPQVDASILEKVLATGDVGMLSTTQRIQYYNAVCQSLDLNPLTRPFEYLTLNSKITMYATRNCTDQLRSKRGVSVAIAETKQVGDIWVVRAAASIGGRSDESVGAVSIRGLVGEALANAYMKAETKAKRRVTLSICGLSWADETEVDSIPNAVRVVDNGSNNEDAKAKPAVVTSTDWEVMGVKLETELLMADDADRVDALSRIWTPQLKDAPPEVRKRVATIFKTTRERIAQSGETNAAE